MNIKQSAVQQNGKLELNGRQIGDEGMKQVCALNTYSICQLFLYDNKISYVGIATFSQKKWDNLKYLYLGTNKLGNRGCKYLSRIYFHSLQEIYLRYNWIGNAGIMHLSKAQWRNIQEIYLSRNYLQPNGAKQLVKTNWNNLCEISLYECLLTYPDMLYFLLQTTNIISIDVNNSLATNQEKIYLQGFVKQRNPDCDLSI